MMENLSPYAIFQTCLGVLLILGGVFRFVISAEYLSGSESLFLGVGLLLLYGLANNTKDKSARGKVFTYTGSVFLISGVVLLVYNIFK